MLYFSPLPRQFNQPARENESCIISTFLSTLTRKDKFNSRQKLLKYWESKDGFFDSSTNSLLLTILKGTFL